MINGDSVINQKYNKKLFVQKKKLTIYTQTNVDVISYPITDYQLKALPQNFLLLLIRICQSTYDACYVRSSCSLLIKPHTRQL